MAKKIVFTGGHHNSALVVAKQLKGLGYQIYWAGHKFTMRGSKNISAEYQEVTAANIPFFELKTGKFYKVKNPFEHLKILLGFIQSIFFLARIKPDLIVSFGGFLSVPVVLAGWILRIPAVAHEQTVTAGWANKATAPFVKKILLTHKSSQKNYPKNKSIVVGLPVRPGIVSKKTYSKPKPRLIYITCGKQGSHTINKAFFPLVPKLVTQFKIVHQTGVHSLNVDQDKARRLKASLPAEYRSRYIHKPYFFENDATKFLKTAHLVIARSGAHITYELLLLHKRSLLIPIPWVSHNEQLQNAQLLKKLGTAVILHEKDLNPDTFSKSIKKALLLKPDRRRIPPVVTNATEKIIKELKKILISETI